jgi:hypothetical protein
MSFDLSAFDDDDFKPAEKRPLLVKPEELPDGQYDFEITKGYIQATGGNGKDPHIIWKMELKVLSGGKYDGAMVDFAMFIDTKDASERAARILKDIGFDSDLWKGKPGNPGARPFSEEFPKAVSLAARMRLRLKGAKKANEGTDKKTGATKLYHNLYINGRATVGADKNAAVVDGKPANFTAEDLNAKDESDPFA